MPIVEPIPDEDAIHRQIDFPRMYNDAKEMIWQNVFLFPQGEPESVVWGKYAPTADDVHRSGCNREATTRKRNPDMRYVGFISSTAGTVRAIRTRPGHGFSVVHEPTEGIHHAMVSYLSAAGTALKPSEKSELKFALSQAFGALVPHSCE
ncbi:MAG TPA: hypothetical protein VGP28_09915 [Methylocella sp.]|jgi:hypothetical protein|nr:hypothetical protein [Methylocella sp.]